EAGLVIKKSGQISQALFEKRNSDKLWLRGPYGRPFDPGPYNKLLLVGGGTGLVPLVSLLGHISDREVTLITGARTATELLFKDWLFQESERHGFKIHFATDDGTFGTKNQVPRVVEEVMKGEKFEAVFTCGPEPMMKQVYDMARARKYHVQASLERVFKCGVGICAACVIGSYVVCKDGPVFNDQELAEMEEFGNTRRDLSGKKVPLTPGH
ncbi:MAG TPA: hypothetical protein VE177_04035, partial [Candidatus Binatus sp.]|nr:hypothetical protein [Candidatus Binatus sp.]